MNQLDTEFHISCIKFILKYLMFDINNEGPSWSYGS